VSCFVADTRLIYSLSIWIFILFIIFLINMNSYFWISTIYIHGYFHIGIRCPLNQLIFFSWLLLVTCKFVGTSVAVICSEVSSWTARGIFAISYNLLATISLRSPNLAGSYLVLHWYSLFALFSDFKFSFDILYWFLTLLISLLSTIYIINWCFN